MWAQVIRDTDPEAVLDAVRGQSFDAPGGRVFVDDEHLHVWKSARIARGVSGDGNNSWARPTALPGLAG